MNLNRPRIHTAEPLSDDDFGPMHLSQQLGTPIPTEHEMSDFEMLGHRMVEWVILIGIGFMIGLSIGGQ